MDLNTLGGVVAYEASDGRMRMCSWTGPTKAIWAKFDCIPESVPLAHLRSHLIDAYSRDANDHRKDGYVMAICFVNL